jgi:hypothetical protein
MARWQGVQQPEARASSRGPPHQIPHQDYRPSAAVPRAAVMAWRGSGGGGGRLWSLPRRHPFAFGVTVAGIKSGCVDLAVQTQYEGRSIWAPGTATAGGGTTAGGSRGGWDRRRTLLFTCFGATFAGAWQYCLFVKIMPRLCPAAAAFAAKPLRAKLRDKPGLRQLAVQVFVENGINNPLLFFPIFYSFKAFMGGHPRPVQAGLQRYSESWREDVPLFGPPPPTARRHSHLRRPQSQD